LCQDDEQSEEEELSSSADSMDAYDRRVEAARLKREAVRNRNECPLSKCNSELFRSFGGGRNLKLL
jgi:hypothetical protein